MSKCTLRRLATVVMYFGVLIFLYPYISGRITTGFLFFIGGAGLAVVCGAVRCYCMEDSTSERHFPTKPCP